MNANDGRAWLVDGRSGRTISRRELLTELDERPAARRVCQPRDVAEALRELTRALVHGTELALLDPNLDPGQVASVGLSAEASERPAGSGAAGRVSWERIVAAAAGDSQARLGLWTSGSTGRPKLVWQSVPALARGVRRSAGQADAVWGLVFRPTHIAGVHVYLQALANGCTVVDLTGLGPAEFTAAVASHGVTHLSATPSFYRLLLPAERPVTGVRSVTLGGESVDAGLVARLRALFPAAQVRNVYASTEAGTLLVADSEVFSIPKAREEYVQIRDGRIHVHRALLGEFAGTDAAGAPDWYDTGDVVEVVDAVPLRFRIAGRNGEGINVGGNKVNPREVEAVLETHPAIRRARVARRRNSVTGELVTAEVELSAAASEAALREYLGERLPPHAVPRVIRFVDRIEQTHTGKVRRA